MVKMWDHQIKIVEKAREVDNLFLMCQMGTGKSRCMVEILREKYTKHNKMLRTLIVCPNSCLENWRNEIKKYSQIDLKNVHILRGSLADRADMYSNRDGIFICNLESFAFEKFTTAVHNQPPNILVIDESHRVKEISAKRTKSLVKLTHLMEKLPIKHRYLLSGSPVLNSEIDLFSQCLILDAGKLFGSNFYSFRGSYFADKNAYMPRQSHFPKWVARPGALEAIKEKLDPFVVRANKDECLTLPPLLRTEVYVEMGKEQKKAYESMKKEFIAFVQPDSPPAIANLAITKALRMQQILSGFLTLENGEIHRFKENPRADALSDLIEDITPQQKCIIWAVYHEDFRTIRDILTKQKIKFAEVTGLVTDKQAELDKFEHDPEVRVMLSSQAAGGTGTNMIQASVMIYYSKNFNVADDMQSEARCHRGGSEIHSKITRIDLVSKGTSDEIILTALRDKKNLGARILEFRNALLNHGDTIS